MALRQIKHYQKDDVLRKKSKIVEKIDERTKILIDDMIETMYHADGVGLAAPQVGILKRVIVVDIGEGVHVLINPEITIEAGEATDYEGCLSVPGVKGQVTRPAEITVEGLNRDGKKIRMKASGLLARAICHEIDHLEGILFVDKTIPEDIDN
ncbi:MAG: peptide deformylase [Clostridiales bacterium]|nr:peptide deformylase [Clostridiales bacterium]